MLRDYLNQTVTHKSVLSVNDYNEKTYSTVSIKGRFIYKREVMRNADNEDVVSDAILYTETAINEKDVITHDSKDWVVRRVYPYKFFDGSTMGYKVML